MRTLFNPHVVPPGGWVDTDPDSGEVFKAASLRSLTDKEKKFLSVNGKPIPSNLQDVILDRICARMPKGICKGSSGVKAIDEQVQMYAGSITVRDVARSGKTLAPWVLAGKPLVSVQEMERRSQICARCPMNLPHESCSLCDAAYRAIAMLRSKRPNPFWTRLKVCAVCHCDNRAQVNVPMSFLQRGLTDALREQLPEACWKKPKEKT